jgi:hypothetical protein
MKRDLSHQQSCILTKKNQKGHQLVLFGSEARGDPGSEGMRRLLWIATSRCGLLAMAEAFRSKRIMI